MTTTAHSTSTSNDPDRLFNDWVARGLEAIDAYLRKRAAYERYRERYRRDR